MLMLLFQVGDEPWALAAADVKDLVPLVTLQPFTTGASDADKLGAESHRARWVGLLNYHGDRIPVIDVSAALGHADTAQMMSTRIALVEQTKAHDAHDIDATSTNVNIADVGFGHQRLGLILDRAYATVDLSEEIALDIQQAYVESLFKGPQSQVVRRLDVSSLLYSIIDNQ